MADYLTNLQLRWKFDEGSGDAIDTIVGKHATFNGTTSWETDATKGTVGKIQLTNSDYFDAGTVSSINMTNNFSVTGWYKKDDGSNGHMTLLKSDSLYLSTLYDDSTQFRPQKVTVAASYVGTTPQDTNWHFVAMTFSSTGGVTIYLDGSSTSWNWANNTDCTNLQTNYRPFSHYQGVWGNQLVHDYRHYNEVLSPTNVQNIYDADSGATSTIYINYLKF